MFNSNILSEEQDESEKIEKYTNENFKKVQGYL